MHMPHRLVRRTGTCRLPGASSWVPEGQVLSAVNVVLWHTYVIRARCANGPGCLTNTVGVRTVITGDGAILKTCTLVASTRDAVTAPSVCTCIGVC